MIIKKNEILKRVIMSDKEEFSLVELIELFEFSNRSYRDCFLINETNMMIEFFDLFSTCYDVVTDKFSNIDVPRLKETLSKLHASADSCSRMLDRKKDVNKQLYSSLLLSFAITNDLLNKAINGLLTKEGDSFYNYLETFIVQFKVLSSSVFCARKLLDKAIKES